jgi:CHAT domain-containing protein
MRIDMAMKKENGDDSFLEGLDIEIAKGGFNQHIVQAQAHLHVGLKDGNAEYLEQAIFYYEEAIKSCDQVSYPKEWAKINLSLSVAYVNRVCGEPVENLKLAIQYCEKALIVNSKEIDPKSWGQTQLEMALTHKKLAVIYKKGKTDWTDSYMTYYASQMMFHHQEATACCQNALQVCHQDTFPYEWATIQINLGAIYCDMWEYDQAILCFENALKVLDCENFPNEWVRTQINLGNVYFFRDKERSIACFENALKTAGNRKEFSHEIGMTLFNFGRMLNSEILFSPGISIDKDKILQVLSFFLAALKIFTPTSFPENCLQVGDEIGILATKSQMWTIAIRGYGAAVSAIEFIYDRIPSEEGRQEWLQKNIQTYRNVIDTCIASSNYKLAVEFVERSKNKNLIKEIENRYSSLKSITHVSFDEIQSFLDEKTALIEWHIAAYRFEVFVITSQNPDIQVLQFNMEDRKKLNEIIIWIINYFREDKNNQILQQELNNRLKFIRDFLHIKEVLNLIPENCNRLILVPHRFLHLLPVHALPLYDKNDDCLLDRFPNGIFYLPSCKVLKVINQRKSKAFQNLFAIQNPDDTLPFASLEVEIIKRMFSNSKVFIGSAATKNCIIEDSKTYTAHCVHFACHGKFVPQHARLNTPLQAHLKLAGEEKLTLKDIMSNLNIKECRLVTLSACETGITDLDSSTSDEYIGLASGFIYAGSSCVIGTLWTVNDIATTILMIKFYEILSGSNSANLDISVSLNQAQNWLRKLSHEDFQKFLGKYHILDILSKLFKSQLGGKHSITQRSINKALERQPFPFEDPYYWAAFIAVGY